MIACNLSEVQYVGKVLIFHTFYYKQSIVK